MKKYMKKTPEGLKDMLYEECAAKAEIERIITDLFTMRGYSRAITPTVEYYDLFDDDMLVCRCEEVTVSDIRKAIADGARDVTGVKRRTRAGMGLCQGRTCEKMVQAILKAELGETAEEISRNTSRPPVRPVTFGSLAGGEDNE